MEDSILNQNAAEDQTPDDVGAPVRLRLSGKQDALLPISVVGGLIGMLAGTLPAAFWVLIFGTSFSPMYALLPLFIYWGIKLFKGSLDKRGFAVICILSVIGFYLTVLSCYAAQDVLRYKMLFTSLPMVTASLIGGSEAFAGPVVSSAYVFPILFTLLGISLTYELTRRKRPPVAGPDPEPDIEANNPGLSG